MDERDPTQIPLLLDVLWDTLQVLREKSAILMNVCAEALPGAVAFYDSELRFIVASSAWRRTLRIPPGEWAGQPFLAPFSRAPSHWPALLHRCRENRRAVTLAGSLTLPDGKAAEAWMVMRPYRVDPGSSGRGLMEGFTVLLEHLTVSLPTEEAELRNSQLV